jgi:hypothetical protein
MEKPKPIVVDACVAINLRASERWPDVFQAGGWLPLMPSIALGEVLYLFDGDGERTKVSFTEFVKAGELQSCELDTDQLELMLSMAARLGAGEAAAIALAHSRELPLATDDRAARRHPLAKACRQITTPELIQAWANRARPSPEAIGRVLATIETRASYRPRHDHPNSAWWEANRFA